MPCGRSPSMTGKAPIRSRRIRVAAVVNASFGLAVISGGRLTEATLTRSGCFSRAHVIACAFRHRLPGRKSRALTTPTSFPFDSTGRWLIRSSASSARAGATESEGWTVHGMNFITRSTSNRFSALIVGCSLLVQALAERGRSSPASRFGPFQIRPMA
jgi:hypothetical protein